MKLGLSSGLAHQSPQEWAQRLKSLGCGSVVFPVNCKTSPELIEAYRKAAEAEQLVIAEVGVWNNVLSPDKGTREAAIEYAIGQLRMADEIGAVCCVNIAGNPVGPRWDGGYRENFSKETWRLTVETTQRIIDEAAPKRTKYSIESMPWMVPTGPDEYLQLIADINRPQFGAHLDLVNMINCPQRYFFSDEFIVECFEKLRGTICSCHMKDIRLKEEFTFQLEETACGKGTLNLELFAQCVNKENAELPVILEHLSSDEEYLQSLAYVQKRLS